MNIDHLRLFVRIASTGNISLAGQEQGLSPAVAGTYIKKLEESLGVLLLQRTTRKVSLTEEGVSLLPHAEEVISSVEAAKAAVGAGSSSPTGNLRISAPASFGRMHLVPTLSEFLSLYPGLKVDLHLSDTIVDLVEGGFDIAIRNAELKDSTLVARKLSPDRRLLCASPAYLAEHDSPQSPADLLNHQCISLMGLDTWVFKSTEGLKTVKITSKLRVDNGEALRDACAQGLGITINSTWSAYQHLKCGDLVEVLPEFPLAAETSIWAVYPSSRLLAPKVRVFIDYMVDRFEGTPYWDRELRNSVLQSERF